MSATIEFMGQIIRTQDGTVEHIPARPAIYTPKKRVTIAGTMQVRERFIIPKRTPTSPQPDPTLLWKWEVGKPFFESLWIQTKDPSGFVYITLVADKPTSDTNLAPLGTHRHSMTLGLSCWSPLHLNTPYTLVHPTLATAAGDDANDFPALLTDAGSVQGAIYEVWARASSTTADVPISLFVDG